MYAWENVYFAVWGCWDLYQFLRTICYMYYLHIFKRIFLVYFSREGKVGTKGRETAMCKRYMNWLPLAHPQSGTGPTIQACALTRNKTSSPLVHRLALNPLSFYTQSTFILPFLPLCLLCGLLREVCLKSPTPMGLSIGHLYFEAMTLKNTKLELS